MVSENKKLKRAFWIILVIYTLIIVTVVFGGYLVWRSIEVEGFCSDKVRDNPLPMDNQDFDVANRDDVPMGMTKIFGSFKRELDCEKSQLLLGKLK